MVNRFHANRAFTDTTDKVTAFQLEVSGRTDGRNVVWNTLERLRMLGPATDRPAAAQGLLAPVPGSRAHPEIGQRQYLLPE